MCKLKSTLEHHTCRENTFLASLYARIQTATEPHVSVTLHLAPSANRL